MKNGKKKNTASLKELMSLVAATHNALALSNHQFLKRINYLECELHL
ncbi:hypothetical protein PRUB_a1904 [Pseudoalteromonas rubra]|uniref:Uncharacterized protein n=1 Tax=Pseudoalteromonas rubra TaxID=43658 RepID=A0A8T0CDK3_9GAMM|nr:hypothetical protein PRUB_a1904 [Pseudoalteromonas rubra]